MNALLRKLDLRHRNNKQWYYAKGFLRNLIPATIFRKKLERALSRLNAYDISYIRDRVNYYNQLETVRRLSDDALVLKDFKRTKKFNTYYYDSYEFTRFFDPNLRVKFIFGDVLVVPPEPTLLKYRPIDGDTRNYVLLKLNKVRLFNYSTDTRKFTDKKNLLIGRAVVKVPIRVRFYERYFNHPMCDLGQINTDKNAHWIKDKITIDEHLDYKFILCLEGYDIASNLRWVMSSNSLAVMPKPKFDSWYMEQRLIPNYHYVAIKDDFSDLEERMNYYIQHPDEALMIIKNANAYAQQFRDRKREDLISLLVLEKYFYLTGQKSTAYETLFRPDAPGTGAGHQEQESEDGK